MDTIDFNPCSNYLELIERSNKRKNLLGLVNNNYSSLGKKNLYKTYGYERHHIIPNYRNKHLTRANRDVAENIALLTSEEHLDAHYYLSKFETKKFKYSAQMAFIQLTSLKRDVVENMTEEKYKQIKEEILKARTEYFTSDFLKKVSSKSGKIVGEIRRKRWLEDAEFREYMLAKLKLSDERKKEIADNKRKKTLKTPPWKKSQTFKGNIYTPQCWEYFDTIYTGILKYNMSYKKIAAVLDVPYKRISNIVRTIQERYKHSDPDFTNFIFYEDFINDYEPSLPKFDYRLTYYSDSVIVPWNKFMDRSIKSWVAFVPFFKYFKKAKSLGFNVEASAYNKFLGKVMGYNEFIIETCEEILTVYGDIENVPWLKYYRDFVSTDDSIRDTVSLRRGIGVKDKKFTAFLYADDIKTKYFSNLTDAVKTRDEYEMRVYGKLLDIRHLALYDE